MKINQALLEAHNKPKERTLGRYHCSELYQIWAYYQGKSWGLKPKNFFNPKKVDEKGVQNISRGCALEDYIRLKLEGYKCGRLKNELNIDGITISGECDFDLGKEIVELKCPNQRESGIPFKYHHQLEAYYRLFNKPVILCQAHLYELPMLKLYRYTPSDKFWQETVDMVKKYDSEVRKIFDVSDTKK